MVGTPCERRAGQYWQALCPVCHGSAALGRVDFRQSGAASRYGLVAPTCSRLMSFSGYECLTKLARLRRVAGIAVSRSAMGSFGSN